MPPLSICSPPKLYSNERGNQTLIDNRKILGSKENVIEDDDFEDENIPPPNYRPLSDRVKELAKPKQKVTWNLNSAKPPVGPHKSTAAGKSKPPPTTKAQSGAAGGAKKAITVGKSQKTGSAAPIISTEVAELKKQVSKQSDELKTLKDALGARDTQIEHLVKLVEQLVANKSTGDKPEPSDASVGQKTDVGTEMGQSLLLLSNAPSTSITKKQNDSNRIAVQKSEESSKKKPESQKARKYTVAEMLKHAEAESSQAKIDPKELAEIDKEPLSEVVDVRQNPGATPGETESEQRQFFEDMMSLAQKWLQKDGGTSIQTQQTARSGRGVQNTDGQVDAGDRKKRSEWSLLLSQAKSDESLSMELNALTMKYLADDHLRNFASGSGQQKNRMGQERRCATPPQYQQNQAMSATRQVRRQMVAWEQEVTSFENNHHQSSLSPGFSMATNDFLGRHGLVQGYSNGSRPANQRSKKQLMTPPANQRRERTAPTKKFEIPDIRSYNRQRNAEFQAKALTPVQESCDFQDDSFLEDFAQRPMQYQDEEFSCGEGLNGSNHNAMRYGCGNDERDCEEDYECDHCFSSCDCDK